jgi:hypothetical protein
MTSPTWILFVVDPPELVSANAASTGDDLLRVPSVASGQASVIVSMIHFSLSNVL